MKELNQVWIEYWTDLMDKNGEVTAEAFKSEETARQYKNKLKDEESDAEIWMQRGAWEDQRYVGRVPDMRNMENIPKVS